MKLEDIGFYTLSDERAKRAEQHTPLMRAELILTHRCNLQCKYCRGMASYLQGDISSFDAHEIIVNWAAEGLQNIRFSGGEPTLHDSLLKLVATAKLRGVKRIAVSTNGTASIQLYDDLMAAGVNDFSVSLDACCAGTTETITGANIHDALLSTIKYLAARSYTTVGIVVNADNLNQAADVITLADSLGVADIRIIPSAQYSEKLPDIFTVADEVLGCHPILKYRIERMRKGLPTRGIHKQDNTRCPLVLDDIAVAGSYHFPCIIYLREAGNPIGKMGSNFRAERVEWYKTHNVTTDPICCNNCLDVCVDYNNRWREYHNG